MDEVTKLMVSISPKSEQCRNFINIRKDIPEIPEPPVTVIIVPIRVQADEEGKILVTYACSLANYCAFYSCIYSIVRHPTKREATTSQITKRSDRNGSSISKSSLP